MKTGKNTQGLEDLRIQFGIHIMHDIVYGIENILGIRIGKIITISAVSCSVGMTCEGPWFCIQVIISFLFFQNGGEPEKQLV